MGCWFACLRFRAKQRSSPVSSAETTPAKSGDRLISRSHIVSLFAPEGQRQMDSFRFQIILNLLLRLSLDFSIYSYEKGYMYKGVSSPDNVHKQLKHEAKFLKACGALLGTPAELISASKNTKVPSHSQDGTPSTSRFSLPDSSCKKLQWDEQPVQLPGLPALDCNGHLSKNKHDTDPPQNPHGIMTYNNSLHSSAPVSVRISAPAKTKSVRFGAVEDGTRTESGADSVSMDTPRFASKHSPGPTPLKLTDEMETPGTVYPAKLENHRSGHHARIRLQYVYPVSKSMNIQTEPTTVNGVPHLPGQSDKPSDYPAQNPKSTDGLPLLEHVRSAYSPESSGAVSAGKEALTLGRKSTMDHLGGGRSANIPRAEKNPGSPVRDRPIVGMVAAHWSSEETTRTSPELWDGKGIPNSTKKYNEDQRVRWHATPFEERLEKALSEEKLHPQRKLLDGRVIELEEANEEMDTATSSEGGKTQVFTAGELLKT